MSSPSPATAPRRWRWRSPRSSHLAILDVSMPKLTGLQAARRIREQRPELQVLILSMHDNEEFFFEALRAGAAGYVLKTAAEQDLASACRSALRGEPFLYPAAVGALMRDYLARGEAAAGDELTPRETEVVKLIAEGHTSREIASVLSLSEHTVERHRANVLEKLQLRDRVDALRDPPRARRAVTAAVSGRPPPAGSPA